MVIRLDDPIEQLKAWFSGRLEAALGRGVSEEQIVLDPGLEESITAQFVGENANGRG